jgi:RNA polymerase sigma-70 factor (ECF subfamily)
MGPILSLNGPSDKPGTIHASDVRVVTDGGGKVRAALDVIEGADRAARLLVEVTRKRAGARWREDFTLRFATITGLPGVIVDAPEEPVQTAAFEIEGDLIRALYVVGNSDKLRFGGGAEAARQRSPMSRPVLIRVATMFEPAR